MFSLKLNSNHLVTVTAAVLLSACGGGGGSDPVVDPATTPPSAGTPTPPTTPTACTAAPIGGTGYSLVFKGCNVAGVAEYYDKTECVRDNATGLIWEGKSTTGNRGHTNVYTNYDSTFDLQRPTMVRPTQPQLDAPDNSIGYQNSVNSQALCGFTNWRMPLRTELQSIQASNGKADTNWFPNTVQSFYWSASLTPSLPANLAIVVNFNSGGYGDFGRDSPQSVRLLRH